MDVLLSVLLSLVRAYVCVCVCAMVSSAAHRSVCVFIQCRAAVLAKLQFGMQFSWQNKVCTYTALHGIFAWCR